MEAPQDLKSFKRKHVARPQLAGIALASAALSIFAVYHAKSALTYVLTTAACVTVTVFCRGGSKERGGWEDMKKRAGKTGNNLRGKDYIALVGGCNLKGQG